VINLGRPGTVFSQLLTGGDLADSIKGTAMLVRTIILAAAIWSFGVTPALCEGGMLTHKCGQHDSEGCGHEGDCHDDPCAQITSGTMRVGVRASWIGSVPQQLAVVPVALQTSHFVPSAVSVLSPRATPQEQLAPGPRLPLLI